MPETRAFIDTNVLLYLLMSDPDKADRTESTLRSGGRISVQVLNELTNVMRRKLAMSWQEIKEFLDLIGTFCVVDPLTLETHERGRRLAERYKLSVYDAMIASAAILAGCNTLYSEDLQDGLLLDQQLRVLNPFR